MTHPASDAELLRRIGTREREAGAELFERYADDVFTYLRRHAGQTDSEDLLQEVFARALRRAATFRGDSSVRTWLHAIARYALYERHRDRFGGPTLRVPIAPGPGPESLAIRTEESRKLLAALEQLPDAQAIVLELHRVDGLTHREIAQRLGITAMASRKRLERTLAALAELLGSADGGQSRHSHVESWRISLLRRVGLEESP